MIVQGAESRERRAETSWFTARLARYWRDVVAVSVLLVVALLVWLYPVERTANVPMDTPSAFLPTDGLYRWEAYENQAGGFRWTNGSGSITLPNPGGPVQLHMHLLGSNPDGTLTRLQTTAISTTVTIAPAPRVYHLLVPPANGERFSVALASPTVRIHKRGIGVSFGDVSVEGGAMPLRLLPALLLASVSGYLFLRRAGVRVMTAVIATLVLLFGAAFWHAADGWRYGLLGNALFGASAACLAAVVLGGGRREAGSDATTRRSNDARIDLGVVAPRPCISWFPCLLVLAVALLIRVPLLFAVDPVGDLELSARRMGFLYTQGLRGAFDSSGDYMPLRLLILYVFAQINPLLGGTFTAPLHSVTQVLIKLPGLLADLATIVLIFWWGQLRSQEAGVRSEETSGRGDNATRRTASASLGSRFSVLGSRLLHSRFPTSLALLYALAPPVWINVAWWGQVDALLTLPLVAAVLLLDRDGGRWAWLCWAAALLIKAQAIVLAPILFVVTVRRYGCRGLLRDAALAGGLFAVVCAPFFLVGEGINLAQAYLGSVERFPRTSFGAYNLWDLLLGGESIRDTLIALGPFSYRQLGMALIGVATLLVCAALVRRNNAVARVQAMATLMLAFFVLPTQIHERYLFLCLVWLCLCIPSDTRFVVPFLILVTTATLNILGVLSGFVPIARPFIDESSLPAIAAAANILVLVGLMTYLLWSSINERPAITDHRPPVA